MKHLIKSFFLMPFFFVSIIFISCDSPSNPQTETENSSTNSIPTSPANPENPTQPSSPQMPSSPETPVVTYTVSFVTEHGTLPDSIKNGISVKENTLLSVDNLPSLSADGYAFGGWYDGETLVVANEYMITKNVTLTAKWTVATVSYTVSFVSSHGTTPQAITLPENTVLLEDNAPTLSEQGYRFDGWFDGENKIEVGSYRIEKNIELTAKWTAGFLYHFDANGGTGEMPDQLIITDGNGVNLTKNKFIREGYIFDGWSYTLNGNIDLSDGINLTGNTALTEPIFYTLYAKWVKIYLVTYVSDYGTVPDPIYVREDFPLSQYSNSLPLLTDENHDFQYWHNGVNRVYRDNYITSDTTLTALWYPKKKELTYYIGSRSVKTDYFYYSETPSKLVYEPSGSDGENLLGWRKNKDSNLIDFFIGSEISYTDLPPGRSGLYAYYLNKDATLTIDISRAAELINIIQRKKYTAPATFTVCVNGNYTDADMKKLTDLLKDLTFQQNYLQLDFTSLQGMIEINDHEFEKCRFVTKIILPEGVEIIGEYAFASDTYTVELPDTVKTIKPYAFKQASVNKIPANLTCIGAHAFECCTSVKEGKATEGFEIPNTVRRIEEYSFSNCGLGNRVIIPDSVRYISCKAFMNFSSEPNSYSKVLSVALPGMDTNEWNTEFSKWYTTTLKFNDVDSNYLYCSGKQLLTQYKAKYPYVTMNEQDAAKYLNGTNRLENEVAWFKRQ